MPIEVRELQVAADDVKKMKEVVKDLEKRMDEAEKLVNQHTSAINRISKWEDTINTIEILLNKQDDIIKDLGQRISKLEKGKS
jgi:Mg2+ and Co2+ transporter CorA